MCGETLGLGLPVTNTDCVPVWPTVEMPQEVVPSLMMLSADQLGLAILNGLSGPSLDIGGGSCSGFSILRER